jgi:NAD(P)-dependent dehydrogenase (short-subunit alcohol dehydrogenase family)
MKYSFTNKTALVFGASKGIGLATAYKLAEYGATVVVAARNLSLLEKHAEIISTKYSTCHAIACDVGNYDNVNECIRIAKDVHGTLDFVVNSAGTIEPLEHLINSDPKLWEEAINVNFKGAYHVLRASAPIMSEQGSGTIITLSSGAANSVLEGWSHYCSTKSAVKKLTEVAHKELAEHNIRIVGLSPGTVATDMMKKIKDAQINVVSTLDWSTHIPTEWAAQAVAFLCGPEGGQFAGTDFSIKTEEGKRLVGLGTE